MVQHARSVGRHGWVFWERHPGGIDEIQHQLQAVVLQHRQAKSGVRYHVPRCGYATACQGTTMCVEGPTCSRVAMLRGWLSTLFSFPSFTSTVVSTVYLHAMHV